MNRRNLFKLVAGAVAGVFVSKAPRPVMRAVSLPGPEMPVLAWSCLPDNKALHDTMIHEMEVTVHFPDGSTPRFMGKIESLHI